MQHATALWAVLIAFAILSLGPVLHAWGAVVPVVRLPYSALTLLVPALRMSGCPVRMTVFVVLCASVLVAGEAEFRLKARRTRRARARLAVLALLGLMVVEFLPAPMPRVMPDEPPWVKVLAGQRKGFGFFDVDHVEDESLALFYQTLHGVPMVGGYIARVPTDVARMDRELERLAKAGDLRTLCEAHGVAYVLAHPRQELKPAEIYGDDVVALYDMNRLWPCREQPE